MREILNPQPTKENPFEIDGYPYGWKLRTKARYWVETNKTYGQREMLQTLNPRSQQWNKPKGSTYASIVILYRDTENGHIECYHFSGYAENAEGIKAFLEFCPMENLSEYQKHTLKHFEAIYKANSHFKIEMVVNPTPEQQAEIDQHNKEYKELMSKIAGYYFKNPDETPEKLTERGSLKETNKDLNYNPTNTDKNNLINNNYKE
jgi:hypothetical protein